MHVIHWKKQAINDLFKIGQYIARDSPTNAGKMLDLIESKVAALTTHPHIGHTGRKHGTYELVAHEHYLVIYRILIKKIEVLRIKHTAQLWPK